MRSSPEALSPQDIIGGGMCIGCGSCVAALQPDRAAMTFDRYGQYKPQGALTSKRSTRFAQLCPFSPSARNEDDIGAELFPAPATRDDRLGRFEAAYVGAVAEPDFRSNGSSGGMVSWVAAELLRRGLVDGVASTLR